MAKKLRILTPATTDGITLVYDDDSNVVYTEAFAEVKAKHLFESANADLPAHLQAKISVVDVDKNGNVIAGTSTVGETKPTGRRNSKKKEKETE